MFFVSLEDDLMRLFGGERVTNVMNSLGIDENMPISSGMLTNVIESSQQKIESRNFAIRKNVLDYDDVMNKQRELIYEQRNRVLSGDDIHETVMNMVFETIDNTVSLYLSDPIHDNWNLASLVG